MNASYSCNTEGTHRISLGVQPSDPDGALYSGEGGSEIFIRSEAQDVDTDGDTTADFTVVADTTTITCIAPPTDTPTPTPTPTPTTTPTPTATPPPGTPTATPVPSTDPSMAFEVYADKEKTQLVCALPIAGQIDISRECDVSVGAFSVDVYALVPPEDGYTIYKIVLQYSENLTLQQQPGITENRWAACISGSETKAPGRYTLTCKGGSTASTYSGVLANIQFVCDGEENGQVDLIGGIGTSNSHYFNSNLAPGIEETYLKSVSKNGKQVADSVVISCEVDTDQDGCSDSEELAPKSEAARGGGRNPLYYWDFFDPTGNKAIGFTDFLALLSRSHAFGDPTIDPLSDPPPPPAYHPRFDRGGQIPGGNLWEELPANGSIGFTDFLSLVRQNRATCRPGPN